MNWKKTILAVSLSVPLLVPTAAGVVSAETGDQAPTVKTEAVDLRSNLSHLLSEHAFLAIEAMRNGADGTADFEASVSALNANTEDLSGAIGSVYGEEAGQAFNEMWSDHIGYFVDYVNATAAEDEDAKQVALDELAEYRQDFSQFLEDATDERLEADSLAEGLQMHVNQLIGAFDSYVGGDYEQAYAHEREAISHMHMVAKGLSSAIVDQFPEDYNNTKAVTPAGDLRASLDYLLSEHAGLAAMAMQNGIDGSDDFEASVQALNMNTVGLTDAIASVYGEEAGEQFNQMWSDHIGYFVDYVQATGAEDEAAKEEALEQLSQYRDDFSSFIETATGGEVPAEGLAEGLQMHADQLIAAFDSYVMEDYDAAFTKIREAYAHMYGASETLAGGIVMQSPEMFASDMPSDMPQTGMGGTSNDSMTWIWVSLISMTMLTGAIILIRQRKASQQ